MLGVPSARLERATYCSASKRCRLAIAAHITHCFEQVIMLMVVILHEIAIVLSFLTEYWDLE